MEGLTFKKYPTQHMEMKGHTTLKIQVVAKYYYGVLQGHKVLINGIKYPRLLGNWYTELDKDKAINNAIQDIN